MPTNSKVLEPRSFVMIKPLPFPPTKGLKVKARSLTVYSPSEPSRQQVFHENYSRRQDQLSRQGYRSVSWKPYQAIGQPLHLEPRQLILHSLGQLDQTVNEEPNSTAKENPEEAKCISPPKTSKENKMFTAKLLYLKYKEKDLKTIRKDLSHTRQLVNTAKRGQGFFKRLKREEEEKQNVLLMEQKKLMEKRSKEWQPPKYSSDEESEEEQHEVKGIFVTEPIFSPRSNALKVNPRRASSKRKIRDARPYTPVHCSLVSTRLTEKDMEPLFRQLCALTWLLETVTVEPPSTMGTVTTCWSARDPGGMKNTPRKINKDKSIETRWEQFVTQPKFKKLSPRILRRTSLRPRRTSLATVSHASDATPILGSASSVITASDDLGAGTPAPILESVSEAEDNDSTASSSIIQSKQEQEGEEPVSDYLQKLLDTVYQSISKELHGEDANPGNREESPTAARSNEKRNVTTNSGTEQWTDLNKPQERPKRKRWETSKCKFRALDSVVSFYTFNEDIQRSLQESKGDKVQTNTETWYSSLLHRIPETVKANQKIDQILKRLRRFGERQSFRVRPHQFLKVLNGLRTWELCSPDISAAIEFMRDKVVQMPAADYDNWLQLKLDLPKRIQSAPPLR
ncbi:coiled-coil domain-containing protein 60-like isoform X3 [Chiloscyllium plagiosum]|uniref:coiled-coil domain-containing protein 60-like isoform X3 n=1 Tax=Chiloscyllium plagiosum TaxID=36176 RepID=UPI001CB858CD|nr:coiled-coil domain-containing protein 60-like isoform X3 [Chiloscyllium plagiosum]